MNWIDRTNSALARQEQFRSQIEERRRTQRYVEPDPRPVCTHCDRHAEFIERHSLTRQHKLFSPEFTEQMWYECSNCGGVHDEIPPLSQKKPMEWAWR